MVGIVLIIIAAVAMKRLVEASDEPGTIWAVVLVAIAIGLSMLIGAFFAAPASLMITYIIFFVKNIMQSN